MSDTYQAVYDAVRSRISGGNINDIVTEHLQRSWDISFAVESVKQEFLTVAYVQQTPFMLLKPKLSIDGNQWCALYGDNLQDGVAGFGDSPADAAEAFNKEWHKKLEKS